MNEWVQPGMLVVVETQGSTVMDGKVGRIVEVRNDMRNVSGARFCRMYFPNEPHVRWSAESQLKPLPSQTLLDMALELQ
ncbi:MAG: hypothetical protein JSS66_06415 [Armatimonadetes bacterium]|nr:hypothetical protein [Armatimonadota bacterium]